MRLFFFFLWLATAAVAADNPAKSLYTSCVACHGSKGEGNAVLKAPNIAGMDAAYLERQLKHFRNGVRASQDANAVAMRTAAAVLKNDDEVKAVAGFIAALPRVPATARPAGDLKNGRNYYNGICSACHGSSGAGNMSLQAPRLAGVDADYLLRQYLAYKSGARGAHADDKFGKQMRAIIKALPNEKTEQDVFAYIATLKP